MSNGAIVRKDSRQLSAALAVVVLIERSDEWIKPMVRYASKNGVSTRNPLLRTEGKPTVELWLLLLLLLLISVAWLKTWD